MGHTGLSLILEKWFSVSRQNLASKKRDCFHSRSQGLDWASSKKPAHGQLYGKLSSSFFPKPSPLLCSPTPALTERHTSNAASALHGLLFRLRTLWREETPLLTLFTPPHKYIKVEANPPHSQTLSTIWQMAQIYNFKVLRQMHSNLPYVMEFSAIMPIEVKLLWNK